nr:hypothetical protein [Rhodocyclus gracilis]
MARGTGTSIAGGAGAAAGGDIGAGAASETAVVAWPQALQNLAPAFRATPQCGQAFVENSAGSDGVAEGVAGDGVFSPHLLQNFALSLSGLPHFLQKAMRSPDSLGNGAIAIAPNVAGVADYPMR